MAVNTRTEDIDELYATTWAASLPGIVQNIFKSTPLWRLLGEKNRFKDQVGGKHIEQRLSYEKNDTVTFFGRGDTVNINKTDHLTVAFFDWKYAAVTITRLLTDEQKNRGKSQLFSMVTSDIENAKSSIIDKFETSLQSDGTGDDGKEFGGLAHLVQDLSTSSEDVGGINQSTYSWWRNNYKSMSGEAAATYLRKRMVTMFNDCGKYGEGVTRFPDLIECAQDVYELYEDELADINRVQNTKFADLGFGDLSFKGRPMVWSPSATDGKMRMLNTNFLGMVTDPGYRFVMGNWKESVNEPGTRIAQIVFVGNLVCSRRLSQGVIHTIAA